MTLLTPKSGIAKDSSVYGIITEMPHVAVKTVWENMYGQSFFLIYEYKYDQKAFPNLLQKSKSPKLRERVLKTTSILPPVCSVADKKELQTSQVESDTSSAIMEKPKQVKEILHSDSKLHH